MHRSVSLLVLTLNAYLSYELWRSWGEARLRRLALVTLGLIGAEILAGVVLAGWALPSFVQPIHLTLATLLFGAQFLTLLAVRPAALAQDLSASAAPAQRVVA